MFSLVLGNVYVGYERSPPSFRKVALKVMPKTSVNTESAIAELTILTRLSHPNIIKVEKGFDLQKYFVMVMELASGGELFDYVTFNLSFYLTFINNNSYIVSFLESTVL